MSRSATRAYLALSITALLMLAGAASAAPLHFRLERSVPAAGATVAPVSEVRLWFSEAPQAGSTSIRLVDAAGELVEGAVAADPDDPRIRVLTLQAPLSPGQYRVMWRAMAADGHIVRDDFAFTVAAG